MSSCDCHIEVRDASQKKILLVLLTVNASMFIAEFIVGLIAQSTGVLADSLDMLADALVYSVSLYAVGRCSSIKIRAAFLSGQSDGGSGGHAGRLVTTHKHVNPGFTSARSAAATDADRTGVRGCPSAR